MKTNNTYQMELDLKPDIKTMSGCMFAGDLQIRKLRPKAIVIAGDTRVGKSTLLNYFTKVPLQGYQPGQYQDVVIRPTFQKGVETINSYSSCTLVPNIDQTTINGEKVGICDAAGFNDQGRTHAGIFGVSYMLQKIFQTTKQIKFVLVIQHSVLENSNFTDKLKPFQNFVNILQEDTFLKSPQFAEDFFNSVAIVAIKARQEPRYYLGKILGLIRELERPADLPNSRKIILMLLKSVFDNKRLDIFKRAQDRKQFDPSQILQNFSVPQRKWTYYQFDKKVPSKYVFQLPFKKQHGRMKDADRQKYKNQTKNKEQFMKSSYQLLKKFVIKAKANWHSDTEIDYSSQFKQLNSLIKNQPYGKFGQMLKWLGLQTIIPEKTKNNVLRMNLLQKFFQIRDASVKVNDANQKSDVVDKIKLLKQPCLKTFDICRKTFCRTSEQQQQFIIFMFINIRSIYESQMQRKIDKQQCAGVPFVIVGGISKIIDTCVQDLIAQFFINFKPKTEQKAQYQKLINKGVFGFNNVSDPAKAQNLLYTQILNTMQNSQIEIKEKRYKLGLQQILKANKLFQQYINLLGDQQTYSQQQKQMVQFKQLQLYKRMGACLQCMGMSRLASQIYQHTQSISLLIKCYEKLIRSKKDKEKKYEIMTDYAKILQTYGKKQRLIELYQQMIDEFECYPARRWQLKYQLQSVLQSGLSMTTYIGMLNSNKLVYNDPAIIYKIQTEITYYVDGDEQNQKDYQQNDNEHYFKNRYSQNDSSD